MTRRQAILETIKSRLEAIATESGFATNVGGDGMVFLNEAPAFGPDDPQEVAIIMLVREDTVAWQNGRLLLTLPLEIQAVAKASLDAPWVAAERVLGDIKRGVELADRRLNRLLYRDLERGTTVTLVREPGSDYVGLSIGYGAPYMEAWGDPGEV